MPWLQLSFMSLLAVTAKTIFTPLETIDEGLLLIEGQTIRSVGSRRDLAVPEDARLIDLGDRVLAPGFIDIHVHGAGGHDVMEATAPALDTVAMVLLMHGTTSFVPTTITAPVPTLTHIVASLGSRIRSWRGERHLGGAAVAEPLGIHLEGPFLNAARRGVHPREHLQAPSAALLRQFAEAAAGTMRILTLAPELEGASELQSLALQTGLKVGLGHSDATFEQAEKAIAAGASHAVHVFNAMRPFAHRDTGILGAVLTDDRIQAEVIADGVHVFPPALRLLLRSKGAARVILATDAVSATGRGPGRYRLGEIDISVERDAATDALTCRNAEGKLAGSILTQDQAIRNIIEFTGVMLREAVQMASWNPARLLGIEDRKGCLRPGADADVVVLEPDGRVVGAMIRGTANFL